MENHMYKPVTNTLLAVLAILLPTCLDAQSVLWDQQPQPPLEGIANQSFPDFPAFDLYVVGNVTLGSGSDTVLIDSVTSYFVSDTPGSAWPDSVNQAVLNIFDGDTLTSVDDPTAGGDFGTLVNVDIVDAGDRFVVTADLSANQIALASGDYFFGLTPIGNGGANFLQGFQLLSQFTGQQAQFRNPAGGFGIGTDWESTDILNGGFANDISLTIRGSVVPEPGSAGLLAMLVVAGVIRRR